jgi:aminotransferase
MSLLNPGDEAIIYEPAWVSYPEQVKLCYGVPVNVPYSETVFDFEKYITDKTRVIIINNPQNPSGKVFSLEELSHLYRLAQKHHLVILSDEAYSDFLMDPREFISIGKLDTEKDCSVICNSISKNYGISGWRLGYSIANAELTNEILKVNQHLITCPATILEYYIARHFDQILEITKPQIRKTVKNRQKLACYMDDIGLRYLPGTATFYFFVSIEGSSLTSEEFCTELLLEHHISTVPGIGYGASCDKFIRVSVGTESMPRIKYGLNMVKSLIDRTS